MRSMTSMNLKNAVGSQKVAAPLAAPGYEKNGLITNKVTTPFFSTPFTTMDTTLFLRSTAFSRFKRNVANSGSSGILKGWACIILVVCNSIAAQAIAEGGVVEQVITTATRSEADAKSLIGSVSALSADDLQLTGHTHIQEALQRIAGVNLQRGNGQEYLPAIRSPVLSGAGACGGFLIAEDGIPLRAAGFCNINELFEAHTELAQRIEVLRGSGTALYGSNALHGIINVITPDSDLGKGGIVGLEAGPYDYGRLKMSAGKQGMHNGIGLSVSLTHDDGYRDESGYDQQKISGRHRYQAGHLTVLSGFTYTNLDQETAGFIEGKDVYKDSRIAESNSNPEAYRNATAMRVWSRINYEFPDASYLLITPYLRYTDMDFLQHFLPGAPLEENGQKSAGIQTAYNFQPTDSLALILGVDAEFTRGYLKQTQDTPTQGSAFLQATIPTGKHYDYEVDATMLAPFVHADWRLGDHWQVTAGWRYEHMNYDYSNNMLSGRTRDDGGNCGFGGCRYSRPHSGEDSFDNWSPKLGVSYQFVEGHRAYLNLARGFRAPQATELYRLQRTQVVADLDSEQVDSIEIGIKGATAALDYSMAVYLMKKDNFIFRDSDFFNVSDGETEHRGVEIELAYRFNPQFDLGLSASFARHQYSHNELISGINIRGKDVDTAPRYFGGARFGWNFSNSGRLELEWINMGSYYLDPENLHQYEGHDLFNVRASWIVRPGWKVFGRVINAADEAYAERADYTSFSAERYFPGTPRAFFAGVEWQWR